MLVLFEKVQGLPVNMKYLCMLLNLSKKVSGLLFPAAGSVPSSKPLFRTFDEK